jgi:hypothetical protein
MPTTQKPIGPKKSFVIKATNGIGQISKIRQ